MKKFLALLLVMVMCVGAGIGGTLAYLTDRETEVNVFTVGNVDIELTENFSQGAELLPGVEIDKDVKIKNVGDNDAWVFYTYAVPANLAGAINVELDANGFDKEENITEKNVPDGYTTVAYLYKEVLKAGEEIAGPKSVTLSAKVDIDPDGNWNLVEDGKATALNWNTETDGAPKMYVAAYAIQAEDFADVKAAYNAYIGQWAQLNAEYDEAVLVATAEELTAALANGESVALTADVTVASTIVIPNDASATLNLNGKNLSYAVSNSGASAIITVNPKAALEITGEGTISFVADNPDLGSIPSYATNTITNEGTLVIGEGVVVTNGSEGGASYAVDNKGKFTLNGGTLIGDRCALRVAKYNQDNVEFVMNGGLVKAATPAWIQLPGSNSADAPTITVTINDGTFQSTKASSADNNVLYTYSYGNSHENTSITINGGMFLGGTVSIGSGYKVDAPTLTINGGTFEYDVLQWVDSTSTVLYTASGIKSVSTAAQMQTAMNDPEKKTVLLTQDYDMNNADCQQSGSMMSLPVNNGKTLDLNDNAIIRPAGGSGDGVKIYGSEPVTIKDGSIVNDGDMTAVDIASGSNVTFENVDFVGNGDSMIRLRADADKKSTVIFKDCTFKNAGVIFMGMNGACEIDVKFINCTFEGSYKMYDENGNLLTDPHGHIHYTSRIINSTSSYLYGSISFDNCKIDYDASESSYKKPALELKGTGTSYGGKQLTVTLKNVTITGEKIVPVEIANTYKDNLILVEDGTNSYIVDNVPVNYDGSAK